MKRCFLIIPALVVLVGVWAGCKNLKSKETILESGLQYKVVKRGTGDRAQVGDQVIVHERMGYLDGAELYSTKGMENLPKFLIGGNQAITGVDLGVRGMKVGEIRRLVVPPHLSKRKAYPKFLSPDSTLVYTIELVEIIKTNE